MSNPKTDALPDVGYINPVSIENVVVLPAPLWPNKAKICPLYIVKSVPLTTVFSPNFLTKLLIFRHSFVYSYLLRESETYSKFFLSDCGESALFSSNS